MGARFGENEAFVVTQRLCRAMVACCRETIGARGGETLREVPLVARCIRSRGIDEIRDPRPTVELIEGSPAVTGEGNLTGG